MCHSSLQTLHIYYTFIGEEIYIDSILKVSMGKRKQSWRGNIYIDNVNGEKETELGRQELTISL